MVEAEQPGECNDESEGPNRKEAPHANGKVVALTIRTVIEIHRCNAGKNSCDQRETERKEKCQDRSHAVRKATISLTKFSCCDHQSSPTSKRWRRWSRAPREFPLCGCRLLPWRRIYP